MPVETRAAASRPVARLLACAGVAALVLLGACGDGGEPDAVAELAVTSPALDDEGPIPATHTCDGEGFAPALSWAEPPAGTVEVAVLLADPDAPGGTFVHWVLAGLDPADGGLEQGSLPVGASEGSNDFGEVGYGPPCPPEGDDPHRYVLTVYAAGEELGLEAGFSADDLEAALEDRTLAAGTVTGTYGR